MKKATTYFLLLLVIITSAMTPKKPVKNILDPKKEAEVLQTVLSVLKSRHIVSKMLDDSFSKKMFKTYLDSLDRNKIYLLESDIAEFKKFETKLDDHLKTNDLTFFFMTHDRMKLRILEGKEMYTNVLKNKLDFTVNEDSEYSYMMTPEKANKLSFCKNKKEQVKKWNNFFKAIVLERVKNRTKGNLELRTNETLLREAIKKEYAALEANISPTMAAYDNMTREGMFQHFMNAILFQFDRYSEYFSPANRNDYLVKQTGKVEGVGISLIFAEGFVQVFKLTEGGPAWKSKKFEIGDIFLKVAEDKEPPVNVAGYSPFEVSKLLKGKAGSVIKITIKKANGIVQDISIKREIVSMKDTFIKSCLVKKNKVTYGVLSFPKFYNNFDDESARNNADDFETELAILKREGAKGLIIDMRGNSGGNVESAVQVLSNFLTKNPIGQVKTKDNALTALNSEKNKRNWDKNVVIIVNKTTASSAELMVSGFKEHNIGVVIGEQTYGKGTVQEFLDLNAFRTSTIGNTDLGAIVYSSQKFYKLNGQSVQKTGVNPDILFHKNDKLKGEAAQIGTIDADAVKPVTYVPNNQTNAFEKYVRYSEDRLKKSENLKLVNKSKEEDTKILEGLYDLKTLNAEKFVKQLQDIYKSEAKVAEPVYDKTREFYFSPEGLKIIKTKEYFTDKRKKWLEKMVTDFEIDEALNILEEVLFVK